MTFLTFYEKVLGSFWLESVDFVSTTQGFCLNSTKYPENTGIIVEMLWCWTLSAVYNTWCNMVVKILWLVLFDLHVQLLQVLQMESTTLDSIFSRLASCSISMWSCYIRSNGPNLRVDFSCDFGWSDAVLLPNRAGGGAAAGTVAADTHPNTALFHQGNEVVRPFRRIAGLGGPRRSCRRWRMLQGMGQSLATQLRFRTGVPHVERICFHWRKTQFT